MRSPSELVERGVDLGASPRAIICWGRLAKVWALLQRKRTEVYPEDIQELAPYILSHRIWLGPHAASHGLTTGSGHQGHHRAGADSMRTRDHEEVAPLVNLADITEIELVILKRMREVTIGDHRSRSHGSGFDFIGLRDWQAGDRFSSIDWAQSSLTNFSPLVVREFEQPSTATVVADRRRLALDALRRQRRADRRGRSPARSPPSACRRSSFRIRSAWSRSTAASCTSAALRPRTGKSHIVHCLDAYQHRARPADGPPQRQHQHVARRVRPPPGDAAGHLRLPVRRRRRGGEGAVAAERARTTCSSC